jgi:hypothetical protein
MSRQAAGGIKNYEILSCDLLCLEAYSCPAVFMPRGSRTSFIVKQFQDRRKYHGIRTDNRTGNKRAPGPDPCTTLDKLLPNLPTIMRQKGWTKGATLMEKWFRQARNTIPAYGSHDVTTITMNWALGYPRARKVYDQAVRERVWVNQGAQKEIKKLIVKTNCLPSSTVGSRVIFGDVGASLARTQNSVVKFHTDNAIQYRRVEQSIWKSLDDLYAALGDFHFHFVVKGVVECISKKPRYRVTIHEVGVYIRDSYDFNDKNPNLYSQPLGMWNCKRNDAQKLPELDYHYVNNASFREWRDK